jgi:hypothetical protein
VTTPAAYPLALVRLAHALIETGYQTVAAPACTGCGRITIDLRRKTASGRICGTCAARDSKGTCARCGQAKRIYARRPEGGICSAYYDKDEQVVTECSGCGRKRRAATRPAAHRRRDHRRRPRLRLVLPGSAAAMRALRADPQDRQAGHTIHPRPVLQLLSRRVLSLLSLRANQALPADPLRQPDPPRLPGPPSPTVLPVRARPPGPGGMARRTSLHRLLRACPPPPSRVRRMRGATAADR